MQSLHQLVVLLFISLSVLHVLAQAIPAVIELPSLPGPYAVGQRRVEVVDSGRLDPLAPSPQPRALMLTLWYPLDPRTTTCRRPAPYFPANASRSAETKYHLPNETLDRIVTHTSLNGTAFHPLLSRDCALPVLVFSPGSGAPVALYSFFTAALASWGYIVVGIDHTYDSDPVEFPDGHLAHFADALVDPASRTEAVIIRGADAMFVASQLTLRNLARWLPGFGMSKNARSTRSVKLGICGHSNGGATAALAMQNSSTPYEAACSFDGPFTATNDTGFHGPFLYEAARPSELHNSTVDVWPRIAGWKEAIQINSTSHDDFTDLAAIVPPLAGTGLPEVFKGLLSSLDANRTMHVMVAYAKAFFDFTLLGTKESERLLHDFSQYPEVSLLFPQGYEEAKAA